VSKQAPQFRPRRSKAQQRSRRYLMMAIAVGLLIIAAVATVIGIAVSGGDDSEAASGQPTPASSSTAGTNDTTTAPVLDKPAARYVIQAGDVPSGFKTLGSNTFNLSAIGFAANGYFASAQDGETQANSWGYQDGYQSSFEPDGQLAGLLQGRYYIQVEAYLFTTVAGASQAYGHIADVTRSNQQSIEQKTNPLGNISSAWMTTTGKVGSSDLDMVYYRFIFQRGNLVSVVQVNGAAPYMTVDRARDLAVVVDQKALGTRPAPTPTPAKTGTPGLPSFITPTP
jgi:hypothetical protein